jgi:ABC-type Mn2+/Zn2+ transport system ATPase subunit
VTTAAAAARGIVVEGLTVDHGSTRALEAVDLVVRPGQVVGLVGPNGAGKSTLVRAVVGLGRAGSGRISAGQVRVDGAGAGTEPRRLAWVPQDAGPDPLFPATVEDVVWMGRYPHLGAFRRRGDGDRRAVAAALASTGLADLLHRPVATLSGGQQRRVAIARALAQQADYVVLDEPYAGLDRPTASDLRAAVRQLAADGVGVLLVNHDLTAVAEDSDHVVLLRRSVQAAGPAADVLTPAVIARAYGMPDPEGQP